MIIKYYKGFVSISKLEEMLKTTKNGTTAYHIVKTLENLGFKAYGLKENKLQTTQIPFIAHTIIESSYKHYMVVYKVTKNHVIVADPAQKIKKLSHREFLSIWTGISIKMYPETPIAIEKSKSKIKLFKLNKKIVVGIGLISIAITIISTISAFFFQFLIDNDNLKTIIIIFINLALIKIVLTHIRQKLLINFTSNIESNLTKRVFKNIIKLPYRYYHNHTAGEIISKINDLIIFKDITLKIILICFIDLPLTLICFIIIFYLNKYLFIISLSILIFYILIILIYHKKLNKNIYEVLDKKSKLNSFMTESIYSFESIKGINIEKKVIAIFNEKYNAYIKSQIKLNNIVNNQNTLKEIINSYGTMIILIVGIYFVKENLMSLSLLITYNILLSFLLEPFKNIISLDYEIKEFKNALNRIISLMEPNNEKKEIIKGNIIIKNLSFSFDDINYVLKKINIKIKENNKVLITGKSASGKSTMLKLIKGYYKNYEGELLIGGKKIQNPPNILYISNKDKLFTGTINYNLHLKGNSEIKEKTELCLADEIIKANTLKENMLLEENGFNISAGQKQRLVLARSLHKFDILLIDEGINALDVNLERKILKNLFNKYQNKTIIIVSHRIDNLDLFDQYIKLDQGQVIFSSAKTTKEV